MMDRNGASWSAPRDLGISINGPDGGAGFPAVASNGTLYFMANRSDSIGGLDIYRAKRIDDQYAKPENLGPVINSRHSELDAYVAPDESYIVFTSDRPGGARHGRPLRQQAEGWCLDASAESRPRDQLRRLRMLPFGFA